jgi:ribonuclease P protein component
MFPQKDKLPRKSFSEVFRKGKVISSGYLSLKFAALKEIKPGFSVVVSSKVSKKATERNLIKRRTYFILRKHKKDIPFKMSLIFFIKPEARKLKFKEFEGEITSLIKKIKI